MEKIKFSNNEIQNGQSIFAQNMRILVYTTNSELFEALDFEDDDTFLEPLLFTYFNSPQGVLFSLEQILCGYLCDKTKFSQITVYSDKEGIVYLPKIGFFITTYVNEKLTLIDHNGKFFLRHNDDNIDFFFKPAIFLTGTNIEIVQYSNALFSPFFKETVPTGNDAAILDIEINQTSLFHLPSLETAALHIKNNLPNIWEEILQTTKKIILFHEPRIVSFVTLAAHGCVFLSTIPENDEVFFTEDLIHQCSHNTLNAVLHEADAYFKIDVGRELGDYINNKHETRSVFSAFHGLYTVAKRVECFEILYRKNVFTNKQKYELLGRISDQKKRFRTGLEQLDNNNTYTNEGAALYELLDSVCLEGLQRFKQIINLFNMSNQPAEFSYKQFSLINPYSKIHELEYSLAPI